MRVLSLAALGILVGLAGACDDDDDIVVEPIFPADAGADVDAVPAAVIDASPQTVNVTLDQDRFMPMDITIVPGTTVVWTNIEAEEHTVTSGEPASATAGTVFDQQLSQNQSFQYTFNLPGEYLYFCRFHFSEGMVGSVSVVAP